VSWFTDLFKQPFPDTRLGLLLFHLGYISASDLATALRIQGEEALGNWGTVPGKGLKLIKSNHKPRLLGEILWGMGKVSRRDLYAALKLQIYLRRGK
jgi:hypothetical protein